jgi:hypothetical protein
MEDDADRLHGGQRAQPPQEGLPNPPRRKANPHRRLLSRRRSNRTLAGGQGP